MKTPAKFSKLFNSETTIRFLELCGAAIVIGLVFWNLQFQTNAICCGDFDGYYHMKWSRMLWDSIRSQQFPPLFVWLPLTTLDVNHYVDHHFLFHILQIPFTWFSDLRMAAKISSALFGGLAVFSCYWLMVHFRIRYSLVWLVALLACSAPFLYRMNMAKAPPFAIIYLIIAIVLLFKQKYGPLLILAFLFTLTYDMFPFLFATVFFWVAVIAWSERRLEWRPVVWVAIGIALGLVINPYFPKNLLMLYQHIRMKIPFAGYDVSVGGEWYPYNTVEFLGNSFIAVVAMVVGYLAFDPSDRKRAHHSLLMMLVATSLMIINLVWKRFSEYWPPFAVLFAAFSLQPWLNGSRSIFTRLPSDILVELEPFLDREDSAEVSRENDRKELWGMAIAAAVAVVLGLVLFLNLRYTAREIAQSEPHQYYQRGAQWMRTNVTPHEIVFNTDWDDFPRLFYFDETHKYVSGLDPNYLFNKDSQLSRLYERITKGDETDPGPLIRQRFRARYVFTDNGHDRFYNNAIESGWFEVVYEDEECTVLRILDQKGEPPPEELELESEPDDLPIPGPSPSP